MNKDKKKLIENNSFNNHINNINEMNTYFKDENDKSKKKYKKCKTLITILKSFDTFVITATTSNSNTWSLTGTGLIVLPISTATLCGLTIVNEVLNGIIINKCNKYKKNYEKDQQIIKTSDKIYRKSLQDKLTDKSEYKGLCNIFTKNVDGNKNESFS